MIVRTAMKPNPVTVHPDHKLTEAWKLLSKKNLNAAPVVNGKKEVVGIIAREDILRIFYPDYSQFIQDLSTSESLEDATLDYKECFNKKIKDIMKKRVLFTRPNVLLMRALARMLAHKVDQLPVLNEHDHLVGMVSKSDIFTALYGIGKRLVPFAHKRK